MCVSRTTSGRIKSGSAASPLPACPDNRAHGASTPCPGKELLDALRKEIEANYEEVEAIMAAPEWQKYFAQDFDILWGALKKVPAGFDPNFKHADWLKHRAYTFSTPLTDKDLSSPDFMDRIVDIAAAGKPMNDFLNYTFEEYGEFPSRC